MKTSRALFVPLPSIEQASSGVPCPAVMAMLCDYVALGYCVIAVTDRLEYGGRAYSNCPELLSALRGQSTQRYTAPFSDVIYLKNTFDPGPFWDAARRFNLSLARSTFVTHNGNGFAAARNAGVGRAEPFQSLFGMAA